MIGRRESVFVGNLGPIPLFIHWSFFFLLVSLYHQTAAGGRFNLTDLLALGIVVISGIVLHELGHGFTARAQGAMGVTVTLSAFGGLCESTRDALPRRDLLILIAGPLVSFLLALLGWTTFIWLARTNPALLLDGSIDPEVLTREFARDPARSAWVAYQHGSLVGKLVVLCYQVNLWLGIFNMLPIYPLDGGQILNILLRFVMRERVAAQTSFAIAVVLALAYLGWDTQQRGQISLYTATILAYVLYNGYQYLR